MLTYKQNKCRMYVVGRLERERARFVIISDGLRLRVLNEVKVILTTVNCW